MDNVQIGDTVIFDYAKSEDDVTERAGVVHSLHTAKNGTRLLTLDLGETATPPFKSFKVELIRDIKVV